MRKLVSKSITRVVSTSCYFREPFLQRLEELRGPDRSTLVVNEVLLANDILSCHEIQERTNVDETR